MTYHAYILGAYHCVIAADEDTPDLRNHLRALRFGLISDGDEAYEFATEWEATKTVAQRFGAVMPYDGVIYGPLANR